MPVRYLWHPQGLGASGARCFDPRGGVARRLVSKRGWGGASRSIRFGFAVDAFGTPPNLELPAALAEVDEDLDEEDGSQPISPLEGVCSRALGLGSGCLTFSSRRLCSSLAHAFPDHVRSRLLTRLTNLRGVCFAS